MRRLLTAPIVLALALSACGGFARSGTAPTEASSTEAYGDGLKDVKDRTGGGGSGKRDGRIEMTIEVIDDGTGKGLAGATVRYLQGETEIGRETTDGDGRVRIRAEPGTYLLQVTGCGSTVLVDRATEAVAQVPAGGKFTGELRVQVWKRRFHPTNSVRALDDAPWPVGTQARMEVMIEDRCTFEASPRASISAFRWEATGAVALVDTPKRAQANGWALVVVRCTERGNGRVVVHDPRDPSDRVDLLAAAAAPSGDRPWCEKA